MLFGWMEIFVVWILLGTLAYCIDNRTTGKEKVFLRRMYGVHVQDESKVFLMEL